MKNIGKTLYMNFVKSMTVRRAIAVILGNIVLGIGAAGLRFSLLGNEPYTAMNMAISDGIHMSLGTYQLILNLGLLVIQLIWGRAYIGFGSIINLCFLGYIVEAAGFVLSLLLKSAEGYTFVQKILFMIVSLLVLTFGISIYQTANLGVAPYDYLALGMTDHFPTPYFVNRVITDAISVLTIVLVVLGGLVTWNESHLGIGTIAGAFFLGPLINFFNKFNKKWIR
ncbi:MAG TPA: DUF6198 family protein [Lachnospiraceae bacterium]|nr:DUF6198 family protein [Lachnospiraceae bacterium]